MTYKTVFFNINKNRISCHEISYLGEYSTEEKDIMINCVPVSCWLIRKNISPFLKWMARVLQSIPPQSEIMRSIISRTCVNFASLSRIISSKILHFLSRHGKEFFSHIHSINHQLFRHSMVDHLFHNHTSYQLGRFQVQSQVHVSKMLMSDRNLKKAKLLTSFHYFLNYTGSISLTEINRWYVLAYWSKQCSWPFLFSTMYFSGKESRSEDQLETRFVMFSLREQLHTCTAEVWWISRS